MWGNGIAQMGKPMASFWVPRTGYIDCVTATLALRVARLEYLVRLDNDCPREGGQRFRFWLKPPDWQWYWIERTMNSTNESSATYPIYCLVHECSHVTDPKEADRSIQIYAHAFQFIRF
jgi:hypothetical protein